MHSSFLTKPDGSRVELFDAFTLGPPGPKQEVLYRTTRKGLLYHASVAPNLLAHGPRGTGKSHMMRWDFHMRAMAIPGFVYLMLRRTMPELKKTHLHFIDPEMEKLGGFYHHTDNVAIYPNGSRGYFGHCETEQDILKHLGSQFWAICFDEITTFDWEWVIKISASCRVPEGCGVTAFVRAGTNPLGVSADEVYRYYVGKDVTPEEDPEYNPNDWDAMQFMPEDNPFLDHKQYRKKFAGLPEAYRKAWLEGEWGAEGAYFALNPEHHISTMPTLQGPDGLHRTCLLWPWIAIYRVLDWGWHDPTVCAWIAVLPNGREIVFKERSWVHTEAKDVAKAIVAESSDMHIVDTFADPTMFEGRKEMGSSIADMFELNGVPLTKGLNNREAIGAAITEHLHQTVKFEDTSWPKLTFLESACPTVVRSLKAMRIDKKKPGRIADHKMDHFPIALGYFCMSDVPATRVPQESRIRPWMKKKGDRYILGASGVRRATRLLP